MSLRDILESNEAKPTATTHPLEVAMGRDIAGRAVMANLAEMPHILISGSTGSGKSSCMNSIITSILMRDTPDKVKMILVDPKRVELGQYDGLPHLLNPVVVDPKKAANALAWAVKEMERRYDMLAENGVRDITGYNQLVEQGLIAPPPQSDRRRMREVAARALGEEHAAVDDEADLDPEPEPPQPLPFILVIVDELNDLMMVAARDVEDSIVRIAQMARAVGIHLVIATQRPSVDVITGVIKANIPSRMAFSVSSLADSRVILDQPGAERLIGKGDMLLLTASSNIPRRLQAPWVSEEEVRDVVRHWHAQGGQAEAIVGIEGVDDGPVGHRRPRRRRRRAAGAGPGSGGALAARLHLHAAAQAARRLRPRRAPHGPARAGRRRRPERGLEGTGRPHDPRRARRAEREVSPEAPAPPFMVAPFRLDSLHEPARRSRLAPEHGQALALARTSAAGTGSAPGVPACVPRSCWSAAGAFVGVRLATPEPAPAVTPALTAVGARPGPDRDAAVADDRAGRHRHPVHRRQRGVGAASRRRRWRA